MNFCLAIMIGPAYLIGGLNVAVSFVLIFCAFLCTFQSNYARMGSSFVYFSIICVIYYFYFGLRVWQAGIDERAARFFHENLIFLFVPLLCYVSSRFDPEYILKRAADWLFPTILVLFVFCLIEKYVFQIDRVMFNSRSPLILSVLVVYGVHISLTDWKGRNQKWKITALISWILGLIIISVFTQSRASFLLYLVAGGFFILYRLLNQDASLKRNLLVALGVFVTAVFGLFLIVYLIYVTGFFPRFQGPVIALVEGDWSALDMSSVWRFEMWRLALQEFPDFMMFGVGTQNSFAVVEPYWSWDQNFGHLHSDPLNHLIGGGVIGATIYLLLLFTPIIAIFANKSFSLSTLYVCLLTFGLVFLAGLTARVYLRPVLLNWAVLSYFFALLVSARDQSRLTD